MKEIEVLKIKGWEHGYKFEFSKLDNDNHILIGIFDHHDWYEDYIEIKDIYRLRDFLNKQIESFETKGGKK